MNKIFKRLPLFFATVLWMGSLFAQPVNEASKGSKTPEFDLSKSGPVLFNQMEEPGSGMMSSFYYTNADMETMTCAAADDFNVPDGETWDVYAFGVVGSYYANMPGGGDTLNVFVLADDNGKPGDTLYRYWAYTNFEKQEVPFLSENGNTYVHTYFEINLPSVITLSAGNYWLSVQMYANANVTGKWGWKEEYYTSAVNGAEWHWINPLNGTGYGYTEWTPASIVVGPWLSWELSFAVFGQPKANDVSIKEITSPESYYYGVPTEDKPVTVVVKNEGTNEQTGFDLKYSINGNEVIENIGDVTLGYNETYTYTFSQKVDLSSPGNYVLKVSSSLANDEYPENDEKVKNIFVFDPTIYTMPSNGQETSITTCSGTFTDAGGLEGDLVKADEGTITIYPINSGDKTKLDFIEFDIGWSDFWIYDGENTEAPMIGRWEDTISPGTIIASYQNTSGALTVHFEAQGWTPFEKPGWSANISCYTPVENEFAMLGVDVGNADVFASDYVPVKAYIKNMGTDMRAKEVTFSANGEPFATVLSDTVIQSDTVVVTAIWHPLTEGEYEITAALPEDNGAEDNNEASVHKYVYPSDFFHEGFEGEIFPPEGWRQTGMIWERATTWPAEGEAHAFSDAPYGIIDTLVTPLLHITDNGKIHFMAFSSAWWPGELDLIWIDGNTGESHFIQSISLPFMWYSNFEVDVSMAAGNNYLAFVGKYNSDGGAGRVEVDEVWGENITRFFLQNDLRIYGFDGENTPEEGETVSFTATVKNLGSQPQSGSNYSVKLMRKPGVELTSVPGVDLDAKQSIQFTLNYAFDYAGEYDCYLKVELTNDEDTTNNETGLLSVYVLQQGTEQVEVGSGNDYSNWFYPITTYASGYFCQMIYYPEELGDPKSITGILYYYKNEENYPIYNVPVQMWFSETTENDMTGPLVAVNNAVKVFDGYVNYLPGKHSVYIPLDFVYDYQGGNLMVTTYKPTNTSFLGASKVRTTDSDTVRVRYYNGYNYILDPLDQDVLDNIPLNQQKRKAEFANFRFFKYDLSGQYCIPPAIYGTTNGDYIDRVQFSDMDNVGTGSEGGPAYSDYLGLTANVERGRTYKLSVKAHFSSAVGSVSGWIDFDGDKVLSEGERVMFMKADSLSQCFTTYVTIPDDAALGVSVLRIRNSAAKEIISGCEAVDYGETEDYSVNIVETQQAYYPVNGFDAELADQGMVQLSWIPPVNPGDTHVESFEGQWPPSYWMIKESAALDGNLSDPSGETWQQNSDQDYVYNGAHSALVPASASQYQWLITPQFLVYADDNLRFRVHYTADETISSKFYVRVKSNGNWQTLLSWDNETATTNHFDTLVKTDLSAFAGETVQIAFVVSNQNGEPVALDEVMVSGDDNGSKGVSGLAGYEIYKNGEWLTTIDDPSVLTFTDNVNQTENYRYCVQAVYDDEGVSDAVCANVFYLEPLTPPTEVVANVVNNDVSVKWIAPNQGITRFYDDFESYVAGEQLACQNPDDWSTWLLESCTEADPNISDAEAYNGSQSVVITNSADLLYKTDQLLTIGKYSINFRIKIMAGYNAYFNVLQEHNLSAGSRWGMQVFFDENGQGLVDGNGVGAASFEYKYDQWLYNNIIVDLDDDTAFYYLNDQLIHSWKWSKGINGQQTSNTLNGADFFAWNTNNPTNYYMDDFRLVQLYDNPNELSYRVYKDGNLLTTTSDTHYVDNAILPGYHQYCVSAVYEDAGESQQVCDHINMFSAPTDFIAVLEGENNVHCSWSAINGDVEGYYVYRDHQKVSGLLTSTGWTDMDVEGGTHVYYVTALYNTGQESLPSENAVVIILIKPKNLVAEESGNDIALHWTGVGEVHTGELVELSQHDGVPANGNYQWFNFGYGVVFDLSAYPDATLEMVDFYHQSWGFNGTWLYKLHLVDWNTLTELAVVGPFETTGDDQWETNIPLSSLSVTGDLIGVFMEPMSHDPNDAYPVIAFDENLDGFSITVSLEDYTQFSYAGGDFLLDLWIWDSFKQKMVQPKILDLNNTALNNTRKPYHPVSGPVKMTQQVKGEKVLTGYNVYYAFDNNAFTKLETVTDTAYVHQDAAVAGTHSYYVTSQYDEGESEPSDTAVVIATGLTSVSGQNGLTVFPNPVKDVLMIAGDQEIQAFMLLNATGQEVLVKSKLNTKQIQLNLGGFTPGIYFLRIQRNGEWIHQKVIKE